MLITLEGIDGSGKTTVAAALADRFPEAVHTSEPTETWYGAAVRRSIEDEDADPLAEFFLYTADHAAHLAGVVRPALDQGALVIADRYADSRFAYQATTLEGRVARPLEYVQAVHAPWSRPPDATLYFDVDPETGAERSGSTNKFERTDFLRRVRANYERVIEADPGRFARIDAARPVDDVVDAALEAVESILATDRDGHG